MKYYQSPNHLISTAEKEKETWYKNAANYYIDLALGYRDADALDKQINAFNGIIEKGDYNFILNPYNFNEDRLKNLPGRLRNYDIIKPIWRRYMGEYSKSSNNFSVIATNDEIENQLENGIIDLVNQRVNQLAANKLNDAGIDSGLDSREVPNVADSVKAFTGTWKQTRAELAQERLNILKYSTDDESVRIRCYSDWINYGEFYTYRDIVRDDVYKEAVPIDEYFPIPNGKYYVEEHDAGVRVRKMTIPQILEYFGNDLTKEQYNYLLELAKEYGTGKTSIKGTQIFDTKNMESALGSKFDSTSEKDTYKFCDEQGYLDVNHIVYKTQIPIKILTYINPLGEEMEIEVGAKYKLDKVNGDIKTETIYRNRVWEQYRFGDDITGLYLKPNELEVQRTDINNEDTCRLPYNGRMRLFPGFPNHGIIETLLPYQIFINILYLTRERAIARNHGKILIIPQGMINGDGNLSDSEILYYAAADGKLYIDETMPNFAAAVSGLKSVDTGDTEYILGLGSLIAETKSSAQEDVDMNRQRLGDTYASDGKYTTQQALIRSSLGSAILNDLYNKTFEKDYSADLDYSKVAWLDGKKGHYLNSDKQVAFFEINGIEHASTSYQIFVVNNAKENEEMNALKDLAFSAGQNGDFKVAAEAIGTDSSTKLKELIRDYDSLTQTRKENAAKAEQENNINIEKTKQASEQAKLESAEKIAKFDGQIKLKIAELSILETELKLASEENRDAVRNEIETSQAAMQEYIDKNDTDVKDAQRQLGIL